jgi:peptidoglycan hydrolase-like protein with peptidoglycan-binding domain
VHRRYSTRLGKRRAAVAAAFVALVGLMLAPSSDATTGVAKPGTAYFLRAGTLTPVARSGGVAHLVAALLAGPTAADRRAGLSSAIPRGTPVRSVVVKRNVVTVDLGARFAAGTDRRSLHARVGQLVKTVGTVPGVRAVRVLVEGGVPIGLFPGYDLRRPLTAAAVRKTDAPTKRYLERLLADLGYLAPGAVDGVIDDQTGVAVLAFQKWMGLPREGSLDAATVAALRRASRPAPTLRAGLERRIEVLLDRQVALLIHGDKVQRVVHISSGAYGRTPQGAFHVYRKERYSWSVPFKVWLPYASYFTGGIAFHEYSSVPTYAASHGCVRVNRYDAPIVFDFAAYGTPVSVLASSTLAASA